MLTTLEARDKQIAELLSEIAKLEYRHNQATELLTEASRALKTQKNLEPAKRTMFAAVGFSALFLVFYHLALQLMK